MKRLLSVIMLFALVLSMTACGAAQGDGAATTEANEEFLVGYARINITPDEPTGLAGHGNTDERKHKEVLDYIYLTCVAMTDSQDNTFLFYAADLCSIEDQVIGAARTKVSEKVGIPGEQMMFNYSHTHSAPSGSIIADLFTKAAVEAAEKALADRKNATLYVGKTETQGLNFVRHYYLSDGFAKGDNHGVMDGRTYVSHTTDADPEMRLLQFKREGGKDVIMINWQTHPHITGGQKVYSMSADIIGAFRTNLEEQYDCLFAFYQGAGGNINPTGKLEGENANDSNPRDYRIHGQLLTKHALDALSNMTQAETGPIKYIQEIYSCKSNKEDMDMAYYAADVVAYKASGHDDVETMNYGLQFGIYSIYHANSIVSRASNPDTVEIEITAVSFGDVGMVFAPYEMFDVNGKYIRDNSPFDFTFSCGYSNGKTGYFPSLEAWEYGCYEADTTRVARGTAEEVAERFVEMLDELHG